ncbi:MAG: hypothetical protein MR575_03340, partial [Bacteroides sp.]|nr:hypothetical protein [Bacteroides sp.]
FSFEGRQELAPVKAFKCKSPTASGRELHDACKGPSGKEQRKGTRSVVNLVNAIQESITCLQLAVQLAIHLTSQVVCLCYIIHSPFFLQSAHFVPHKTFSRNKTPLKTHLVQLKTFIRNEMARMLMRQV